MASARHLTWKITLRCLNLHLCSEKVKNLDITSIQAKIPLNVRNVPLNQSAPVILTNDHILGGLSLKVIYRTIKEYRVLCSGCRIYRPTCKAARSMCIPHAHTCNCSQLMVNILFLLAQESFVPH